MRDINDFQFTGPFADIIPEYVQYKRSCGFKVAETDLYRLREIDRFFKDMGISCPAITRDMYDAWTKKRDNERDINTQRRHSALVTFGKYLISIGYDDIYTGGEPQKLSVSDYIPYVFSKEEIQRIFTVMERYCSTEPGYKNDAFYTMVCMYYCCGFRKSEVVMLRLRDIELETGKITVLNSKNNVSRLVPVSDSLRLCLQSFCRKYHKVSLPDTFLFHGTKNRNSPFCRQTLYKMYHSLLKEAGIPDRPDGRVHRLHDMRHTFCTHALEQMQEKGFDLYTSLPLLSTYLGHRHLRETEHYLRLAENRQESVVQKAESYSPGLFPKMGGRCHE